MDRLQTLSDRLRGYRGADALEASHRARMQALVAAPGDPFDRLSHDPGHFTASAWVLAPDRDAVLLVYHRKLERWLQPGGHVEHDDADLRGAALREAAEETGLTALEPSAGIFDLDVHTIPPRPGEPGHLHFDVRFLFRSRVREARPGSDAGEVRWFGLSDLEIGGDAPAMQRVTRKLRELSPTIPFSQETDR